LPLENVIERLRRAFEPEDDDWDDGPARDTGDPNPGTGR
jgi:hypothetical protein